MTDSVPGASAEPPSDPAPSMVDWRLAVNLGTRLAGDGPQIGAEEAVQTVAELRKDADASTGYVRDFTGLDAPEGTAPALVVDRGGWIQANADGFAKIIDPIAAKVAAKRGRPSGLTQAVGSRVTGAEIGGVLGYLGGKVLGQFDPFFEPHGRLLLVAPNIVHVERSLTVDPADFRLWVCLHEETHRVQFTANPWLREHLFDQMMRLADTIEPTALLDDLPQRIGELIKERKGSLMEMVSTPEQREVLDGVTGVMSLLEGHADVVMDGVGPSVIPSVAAIRRKFDRRRQGIGALDRLLRRLLGMDAKMAQYRDGATFVRGVVDTIGMAGFNAVWAGPETLPTKSEIHDYRAWIDRVHG